MAPLPPIGLSPMPPPKLRGALGWCGRGHHPGCGGPKELRAETAGPVAVVDFCDHVYYLRAVCCLLEHLCLYTTGLEAATNPLRDWRTEAGKGRSRSIQRKYLHLFSITNSARLGEQETLGAGMYVLQC